MSNNQELPTKTQDEINECILKQKALCDSNKDYWHFAPHDGYCYSCKKNIYQNYGDRAGYTGESYITGCRHCHTSYCD